ncbi:hypothetical protein PRIPAC_94698 [Pristionchus pacificus]|uniref:protein-tyrosine-phosphatase n=1 Tax=Pristionchus pacificus TaxID=54126 RepID=A0A2A6B465_PRIPA|nr:hypothetical protein PRIPAC_94698 [Pristionchus pacificus]|eukprot:PDM60672.1 tyrosine phosphatase [Pristionchus pacificus]
MAQDADSATSNVSTGVSISNAISSSSSSSIASQECRTCPPDGGITPMRNSYASFPLAPGQFLHDVTGNEMTLDRFGKLLCTSSVYRLFYSYTTIISRDGPRCTTSFTKNVPLNRYLDVPCFEDNRIVLEAYSNPDYIHANFVDGFRKAKKYICAQSPLQSTIDRFWDMVWQEKVVTIVAMYVPNYYFPLKSGEKSTVSSFTITHQGTTNVRGVYDATVLLVTKGSESRRIVHFEYFDWPRKCTPRQPSEVLALLSDVRYNQKLLSKQGEKDKWLKATDTTPILVHCSTGAGRSAALIALDIICEKMDKSYSQGNCMIDVADTVTRLRTQRSMAVQKPEEFVFLNLVSLEYALRKKYFSSEDVAKLHMSNYYLFPEPETGDAPEN